MPPRKNPPGNRMLADIRHADATRRHRLSAGTTCIVKANAACTSARSVPWAWPKVHISRRVSKADSRYQPTLKACMTSRPMPSVRKHSNDHHANCKCRRVSGEIVITSYVFRCQLFQESNLTIITLLKEALDFTPHQRAGFVHEYRRPPPIGRIAFA